MKQNSGSLNCLKWTWPHQTELKQQLCCFQGPPPLSLVCSEIMAVHLDCIYNIHLIRFWWSWDHRSLLTHHHFFPVLSPKVLGIAVARYDFCARDMRELSLLKGDVVKIYTKMSANGWWRGEVNGRVSCPSRCACAGEGRGLGCCGHPPWGWGEAFTPQSQGSGEWWCSSLKIDTQEKDVEWTWLWHK